MKGEVGSEDHFSQEVFAGSRFWFDLEISPEAGRRAGGPGQGAPIGHCPSWATRMALSRNSMALAGLESRRGRQW